MAAPVIDPGGMTARLSLEEARATPDGQGGATVTWEEIARLWGRIEPFSQGVAEQAGAERVTISHRIWLYYREGIAAGMRLRKGARIFTIRTAHDPDETRRLTLCSCQEEGR